MIILLVAIAAMLTPALLGGRLARLALVRFRHGYLIALTFLFQLAVLEFIPGPRDFLAAGHIATYLLAGAFVVMNRRIPGLWLVGLGAASNGITIAINGGTLPAREAALRTAGIDLSGQGFLNSGVLEHPRLALLGDIFAIPAGWPLANVYSIGDVLIVLGAAYASYRICGTRWTRPWNPYPAGHGVGRHRPGTPALSAQYP
jgi:hypothetical protein